MKVRNKRNGVIMEITPSAYRANPKNWIPVQEEVKKPESLKKEAVENVEKEPKKDTKDWLLEQLDAIDPDHAMNKRHSEETLSEKLHELKTKDKN